MRRLLLLAALLLASAAAQAFSLKDSQGRLHQLADYRGKWVLVNFWATWCPPCLEEIPDLVALYEARRDLMVIGVAMDERNPAGVQQFADSMLISYPIVLGDARSVAQFGRIIGLPTTFLYDPSGRLATTRVGPVTRRMIEQYIEQHAPGRKPAAAAVQASARPDQAVRPR